MFVSTGSWGCDRNQEKGKLIAHYLPCVCVCVSACVWVSRRLCVGRWIQTCIIFCLCKPLLICAHTCKHLAWTCLCELDESFRDQAWLPATPPQCVCVCVCLSVWGLWWTPANLPECWGSETPNGCNYILYGFFTAFYSHKPLRSWFSPSEHAL